MTPNAKTAGGPAILYVDFSPGLDSNRRRLDGMRRYAAARGWRVETLDHADCSPAALRNALAKLKPIGCAAECWCPGTTLRPRLFGRVPVVYFSPSDRPGWRNARGVTCDEAAVARMAFEELSAGNPPSYAVMSCWKGERWARERIDAFRECCRKAGAECKVAYFTAKSAKECPARFKRMVPWAAALPPHCAVFAVNDCCARCAAKAMAAAGRSFPRTVTLVGADGVVPQPPDKEVVETVSTVRLDFEYAGYLAAKAIMEIANKDCDKRQVTVDRRGSRMSNVENACRKSQVACPEFPFIFPPLIVDRRKSTRGYGRREPRILEAMEMIRREACDGLTVATLAARFPGTRRLFDMRFREAAGHSALDEIINVRLARAMELLAGTDLPIAAVANFSGFKTELEFWKLFSKRVGMPPLGFRNARR